MHRALVIVVVAGCGGGHATTKQPAEPVDNSVDEPARVMAGPCPAEDVLLEALRTQQPIDPTHQSRSIDACMPGAFGKPGWVVAARTESQDMEAQAFLFVIDAEGALIAGKPEPEAIDFRGDGAPRTLEVADLDGDGVDEVLQISAQHEATIDEEWLSVYRLRDRVLDGIGGILLRYDEPTVLHCEATYEIAPPRILVTRVGQQGGMCEPPGEASYEIHDGSLQQQ